MSVPSSSSPRLLQPQWYECMPLTRREELEQYLSAVKKLIERADNGEFTPEFLKRMQARREQIVKELETIEEKEATN